MSSKPYVNNHVEISVTNSNVLQREQCRAEQRWSVNVNFFHPFSFFLSFLLLILAFLLNGKKSQPFLIGMEELNFGLHSEKASF
jgi:hypothetical protein